MTTSSRRHFLGTAAAAALAGCCTMTAQRKTGAIDAHVHVWTRDTDRYPLKPGAKKADVMKPPSFTPAELMAPARPQGVALGGAEGRWTRQNSPLPLLFDPRGWEKRGGAEMGPF